LNCTAIVGSQEVVCEDIVTEDQPVCSCPDCVRTLKFIYTGQACPPNQVATDKCADVGPNPFVAGYRITNALDQTEVLATGQAQQGEEVTIDAGGILACIPDTLAVTISVPTGTVTQTFTIDSSCDGRQGLILLEDYGSFESTGYSCSATDVHDCKQEVNYGLKVCNTGSTDETIYEWFLKSLESELMSEEICDLLEDVNPEDVMLAPGECFYDTKPFEVDRCAKQEYCVDITANATNPLTGIPSPCSAEDEIKFGWPGLPPTPPTDMPSPMPSPAPSPAPSSSCVIDIELTGCPNYNLSLDNNCEGRPQEITFRYLGGGCAQSDNLQPRQKFNCADSNGGPPRVQGTPSYITAVPTGGSDLYFAGPVLVGDKYTLNAAGEFDKLSADMTIEIFSSQGGTLLQVVNLHLSCSQPLFLFDKFGASQVTEWVETSGRVVSDSATDVQTGTIVVQLNPSTDVVKPVRLLEMAVLTNTQDQPIDYTPQIAGKVLGPGDVIELPGFGIDIELGTRVKYTFFTTIIGETIDGTNMCNGNSFLECTVGFNLEPAFPTMMPTPRPTLTPFPTRLPNVTACEIASNIVCTVLSPLNTVTCDRLTAPISETCPATSELLVAFLQYDGSQGQSVFVIPTCDKSEYFAKEIQTGEVFEFRSRASDTCEEVLFTVYSSDPDLGGSEIGAQTAAIACPGPWTIGNTIAPGITLAYYASTEDNGITFDFNTLEAEVQIDYVGLNTGRGPLTVVSGEIAAPSPFTSGPITGVPSNIPARDRLVLQTDRQTIQLSGRNGEVLSFTQVLQGAADNEFALPCEAASSYLIEL